MGSSQLVSLVLLLCRLQSAAADPHGLEGRFPPSRRARTRGPAAVSPAVISACVAGGAPTQAFDLTQQYGGVISVPALGACLCSPPGDAPGALAFQECDGPGAPLHAREIGWNFTGAGAIPKAGTGLCATAAVAAGGAVMLAPCQPGASQEWSYDVTTQSVSSGSLCLTAAPAPLPLLSNVFGSNMVLQRDVPAEVWGWTAPGGTVVVSFAGANTTSAPTGTDGRWSVALPPTAAGEGFTITTIDVGSGKSAVLLNVAFGDVVWCSGQSNLSGHNTPVRYAFNATAEIAAAAAYPWVRVFAVGVASQGSPAPLPQLGYDPYIPWSVAAPSSVALFSATCWFHGKAIADALGPTVPIGLIESAWGGTSIQVWEPAGIVSACGDPPAYPGGWPVATSSLWNSMTAPFAGMRVSGIVWYQGESNSITAVFEDVYYTCALPFLVASLREAFLTPAAYAAIVQLAPWASTAASFNGQVATLREAQLVACDQLPNMTAITAVDGGDPFGPIGSIHPRAKQLVGRRLAGVALTHLYGVPTPFAGPRYASAVAGSPGSLSATVSFAPPSSASPGNDGAMQLLTPSPVGPHANSSVCPVGVTADLCSSFALRGSDGVWYAATATLDQSSRTLLLLAAGAGDKLTATATASGWSLWPISLLYSSAGLPAWPWNASIA